MDYHGVLRGIAGYCGELQDFSRVLSRSQLCENYLCAAEVKGIKENLET